MGGRVPCVVLTWLTLLVAVSAGQNDSPRILKVYGAPGSPHDQSFVREGSIVRSVYDKPFFAALKIQGKNEIATFLLKDGLSSLSSVDPVNSASVAPTLPPARDAARDALRDALLSSTHRIGITLSAARYLQLPEMKMPIARMVLPQNFTLDDVYQLAQDNALLPWMYLANKEDLPVGAFDKLIQVGQFAVSNDKLEVASAELVKSSAPVRPLHPEHAVVRRMSLLRPILTPLPSYIEP